MFDLIILKILHNGKRTNKENSGCVTEVDIAHRSSDVAMTKDVHDDKWIVGTFCQLRGTRMA